MGKFFSRFKTASVDPEVKTFGNMANFYSLLIFLIAIPFILIIGLVWLTGIMGFNTYIFAGFACLLLFAIWRLYRRWGIIKSRMSKDIHDMMQEAAASGKDVELSLMNGVLTLRYTGANRLAQALPAGQGQPLALDAPALLEAELPHSWLSPERFREEVEGLLKLRDEGIISPEDFDRLKESLLQRIPPSQATG